MSDFPASAKGGPGGLEELYQSVILDHNRRPRNHREMESADAHAEGKNPLCGDAVTVWLRLEGDTIADVSFKGVGCAISRASASIMTTVVKGKTIAESEALFERFHGLVTGRREPQAAVPADPEVTSAQRGGETAAPAVPAQSPELGSLAVFSGVSRFPVRVKCASLSWHTLRSALREAVPDSPAA
jgi:nitrogen fixation protein NifU and related proteins